LTVIKVVLQRSRVPLNLLIVRGFSLLLSWQARALATSLLSAAALLEDESGIAAAKAEPGARRGCLAVLSAFVVYLGNKPDDAVAAAEKR
jgi:hypothetical protein